MIDVTITGFYAGLTALLALYLAYQVTVFRRNLQVGIGDNNDHAMLVAIRAHANLLEYAPIVLVLLLIAELSGAGSTFLHVCGTAFFLSRLAHAWGLVVSSGKTHAGRLYGTGVTWLVMVVLAIYLIF